MLDPADKKVRIPVRRIGDKWELEFGGDVPVKDGQEGELILPEKAIIDPELRAALKQRSVIKILDRGAPLRAYLATKMLEGVSEECQKALLPWPHWKAEIGAGAIDNWSSGPLSFFELSIGPATDKQRYVPALRDGGLWLEIKGRKANGLLSSTFELPDCVATKPATSLNHAFTILSEVYEPWRISHTGSVYERFLYQETDGRWYPLSLLRDARLADNDQQIAQNLWKEFMRRMKANA